MAEQDKAGGVALAPAASAIGVLAAGIASFAVIESGPLSIQMTQHLAVMNVLAPLAAIGLYKRASQRALEPGFLWLAAFAQLALLWIWHAPAVQTAAAGSFGLHLVLMLFLGLAAVAFWSLLLAAAARRKWSAVAVLLVTGKLACLLGALMIFATRDLYRLHGLSIPFCNAGPSTLEDQHLAGLLMITACPLSYLVAGAVLAAQMIGRADDGPKSGYRGLATG